MMNLRLKQLRFMRNEKQLKINMGEERFKWMKHFST